MSALRARLDSHAAASSSSMASCTFKSSPRLYGRQRAPLIGRTRVATSTGVVSKTSTVSAAQKNSAANADSWFFTETGQKSWVSFLTPSSIRR
jgi:hypothetical protein